MEFRGLGFLVDVNQELSLAFPDGREVLRPRHVSASYEIYFDGPGEYEDDCRDPSFGFRGVMLDGKHWLDVARDEAAFAALAAEEEDCSD
jgi:hypothetical protein